MKKFQIGQTVGKLTIISENKTVFINSKIGSRYRKSVIPCICTCGTKKDILYDNLRTIKTPSCGSLVCKVQKPRSESFAVKGKVYGKLTVIKIVDKLTAKVKCTCGKVKIVYRGNLQSGIVNSCGGKECREFKKRYLDYKLPKLNKTKRFKDHNLISVNHEQKPKPLYHYEMFCKQHSINFPLVMKQSPRCRKFPPLEKGCPECSKTYISTTLKENDRFGNLTLKLMFYRNNNQFGKFLCDCGNTKEIRISSVKSGITKSCGCLIKSMNESRQKKVEKVNLG